MTGREPEADQGAITREGTQAQEEEGFDLEAFKEVAGFVVRSPRRRPWLAAGLFVVLATVGVTVATTIPRAYNVQAKLLAQRALVLPAITNPTAALPREVDDPTRNVGNVVMRRDNLIALINENRLIERFYGTRSAALRLKDWAIALFAGPLTPDDRLRVIVGTLEKRMQVFSDESSVTINVDWNDPRVAYDIALSVQKHFLDASYDSEVSMIRDAIAVLEDHAKGELDQVDAALADYERLRAERAGTAAPSAPSAPPALAGPAPAPVAAAPKAPAAPDPDLAAALDDKRRQIRAIEDERQREKDTLRQQLNQAQLTLTSQHPTVIALRQQLDALDQPSLELVQLKAEENALLLQIAPPDPAASAGANTGYVAPRGYAVTPRAVDALSATAREREDPSLAPARERLESAIHRYQDVTTRIEGARLQLDIARTAFPYRYSVMTPPEMPRGPKKPLGVLIGIGSVLGAIFASLLGAAAADMFAGRILETWQLRRRLKLEVLGELELPE